MTEFLRENEKMFRIYCPTERFGIIIKNEDYNDILIRIKEKLQELQAMTNASDNKISIVRIG